MRSCAGYSSKPRKLPMRVEKRGLRKGLSGSFMKGRADAQNSAAQFAKALVGKEVM